MIGGCKKAKNGVLEVRKYVGYPYSSTVAGRLVFEESFDCILITEDLIDFEPGEIKQIKVIGDQNYPGIFTHYEYIFHPNESARSLGYKVKMKGEFITHYGTSEEHFYNDAASNGQLPGENSGFSQLAGAWRYPATGEVIWINSDRNGSAKLIFGGNKFPQEALGGIVFTEIHKTEQNIYRAKNHTYYPGSGWQPASYLNFEIKNNGNNFTLGSTTWEKVH
jgi:hypothetical protein